MKETTNYENLPNVPCKHCHQIMDPGNGCTISRFRIEDKFYDRIKAGDKLDMLPEMEEGRACHDCNVKRNQYHHFGCDMESCPRCHGQLIACGCDITYWY